MSGRLADKVAIVVGGGQTPGATIGNGRATAVLFAREGAKVLVVDRSLEAAQQTVKQIEGEGGSALAHEADATNEAACVALVARAVEAFGRIGRAGRARACREWTRIYPAIPPARSSRG